MKKVVSLVLAFAFVASIGTQSFAANTKKEFTASVSFSGGTVTFNATYSGSGTALTWDTTGITLGSSSNQWKTANGFFTLTKTISVANGTVTVYQNNKGTGTAAYVATTGKTVDTQGHKNFNGLVKGGSGGGEEGYRDLAFVVLAAQGTPDWSKLTTESADYRYMIDQSNYDFSSAHKDYDLIANKDGYKGIANSASTQTAYMYVGANFKNVLGGESYGTNHIVFEYGIE